MNNDQSIEQYIPPFPENIKARLDMVRNHI